ncbi:MAG: calcium-binding protein, partial [Methylophaga sp.]
MAELDSLFSLIELITLGLVDADVTDFASLTITSIDGGPIDNAKLNEFLGTVYLTGGVLDASLLDSISISATDTGDDGIAGNGDDLSDSASFNELIDADVNLLSSPNDLIIEGSDGDNTIDRSSSTSGERIYGLDGDDTITAGSGNDLIRGGAGDDTIDGNAGNDIVIGGIGDDSLTGGSGNDLFRWEKGHAGTVGTPAVDTVTDFSIAALAVGGDVLDLSDLLQGEARVGDLSVNLTEFMSFSYDEMSGNTTLSISTDGSGDVDQLIVFEGVNFFDLGDTDLEIIQSLLQSGQLLVDEAQAGETYQGGYTDVDFVVTDNDGDTENTNVRFDHDGIEFEGEGNVAPEVDVSGDGLLGLLGVSALGAIDFGTNQTFKAFDRDNNITRVEINFGAVIAALGGFNLTFSVEAAEAFGLQITASDGSALSLLGNTVSILDFSGLVITSEDGGTIDNL